MFCLGLCMWGSFLGEWAGCLAVLLLCVSLAPAARRTPRPYSTTPITSTTTSPPHYTLLTSLPHSTTSQPDSSSNNTTSSEESPDWMYSRELIAIFGTYLYEYRLNVLETRSHFLAHSRNDKCLIGQRIKSWLSLLG